jgi:uncharacterized membrane protein (DUF2068 family)
LARQSALSPVALRVIGAYKLAKAVVFLTAGVVIFRHRHDDVAAYLLRLATRLGIGPDNHLLQKAAAQLSKLEAKQIEWIGVLVILYAILFVVEGVGLILQRKWAEYLVIVATALLIPFEIYEIVEKVSPVRVGALLVNIAIVAYLAVGIRRERSAERGPS